MSGRHPWPPPRRNGSVEAVKTVAQNMTAEARCAHAEAVVREQRDQTGRLATTLAMDESLRDDFLVAGLQTPSVLRLALAELQAAVMGESRPRDEE